MQGSIEKRGSVGVVWIDNPPVNAISHDVRQGLVNAINTAAADDDIEALVLACRGRTFMAGADIAEFAAGMKDPLLPEVNSTIAASPKLVVAAMFGTTFGGGFEVALACNYRISAAAGKVGLPEVKLGILPGAHGTQRLTRVAGVEFALKLMTSGNPASAKDALAAGAIDRLTDGDVVDDAVAYANELLADNAPLRRTQEITPVKDGFDDEYFAGFRKSIARKTRGMRAPERIIRCVEAALEKPFDEGVQFEREMFMECANDSQAKALQHVFFAERQTSKVPGVGKDVALKPIESVGIIGAGTMGGGISMNFANAGIPVKILEMNDDALQKGLGIIRKNYEATARKGRMTEEQVEQCMALLNGTTHYSDLADVDLVIEAVFENMEVKKTVFSTLNETVSKDTVLATNTSYLDINEIASVVDHPERVLGMHFFSPANVMKLLEIIRAEKTAPEVLATVLKLSKTIRKVGAVAGVCFGFIGNRMLSGYAREAQLLVLEGAKPEHVDRVLFDFGMPMGVLAMGDLAGIDIGYRLREQLDESQYDKRAVYVSDKLVEMGRLGQKTGAGTYDYEPGNRNPIPSPITEKLIAEAAEEFGIQQRKISDEEIIERCFYSLFNTGCNVLDEGMAYRSSDIDIVYIYGYGFPAWRGGPMHWAEHGVGLDKVLDKIKEFGEVHGERWWKPSPLLERLVADSGSLSDIQNR
ncbi:MAG: 3-hydroxyacyl-CoA dehydrogenase NAD-binding domain-containing protein [Pseudomonadota bacterium]